MFIRTTPNMTRLYLYHRFTVQYSLHLERQHREEKMKESVPIFHRFICLQDALRRLSKKKKERDDHEYAFHSYDR